MSSTRNSKRKAASSAEVPAAAAAAPDVVVLQPEVIVVAPSAAAADTSAPMTDADLKLQAAGGPVPSSLAAPPAGFEAAAPEETTGHKAKRLATEASKTVSQAVTAGLETASVVIKEAAQEVKELTQKKIEETKQFVQRETTRTTGPNAATVAQAPYNMNAEPGKPITLADKTHEALNSVQFAGEKAINSGVAGLKSAAAATAAAVGPVLAAGVEKVKEGAAVIGEKAAALGHEASVKASELGHEASVKASAALADAKVAAGDLKTDLKASAAYAGATLKSAVTSTHSTITEGVQTGLNQDGTIDSSASHGIEKKDGSLPIERVTDEFPHPRPSSFERDSRIPLLSEQQQQQPIIPLVPSDAIAKTNDAPLAKASSAAPIDLLSEPMERPASDMQI